ncbi:hypothetical protein SCUCBS95973_008627 [Sporothrix curviconia]|uniref:Uncharacterized protein n=1 Tax=Sporothrix curviconia TaxID=1260050 RepID=A0ABP0CQA0_9PEZI
MPMRISLASTSSTLPEVDIVIHNLHAEGRGTSRSVRRLPVAVLLAHMMGIIGHRGLLLHSDGTIGKDKVGPSSGFSTFVDELVNLPKEAWAGSGGSGDIEWDEHVKLQDADEADEADEAEQRKEPDDKDDKDDKEL